MTEGKKGRKKKKEKKGKKKKKKGKKSGKTNRNKIKTVGGQEQKNKTNCKEGLRPKGEDKKLREGRI